MKFNEFVYEHLDYEVLSKEFEEKLSKLEKCDNPDDFMKVFKEINKFRGHFSTMSEICYIRHSIDTSDKYYDDEKDYWDNTWPLLQEYENRFNKMVLDCPFRDKLTIPKTFYQLAENAMKSFSTEVIEQLQEENKLVSEYGKLKASAKIEFDGEIYNLSSISPKMMDEDRDVRKRAAEAVNAFYTANEERFDDIYDKLVKVRDEIARKLGYKNYVELAYIRMNRLDYDEKMVENYRNQVIKDIVPLSVELRKRQAKRIGLDKLEYYDQSYEFKSGNPMPHGSLDELVAAASKMYDSLSEKTSVFFRKMVEQEMFDLPTRPNKEMGGYCTGIYDYKMPFIFSNSNGTAGDVDTLTHEAGHAFQAYCTYENVDIPDLIFPTNESAEIHSMTMEFFGHPYSELFFKEDAEKYHYFHIASAINFLPYGCLVDHFQHEVYYHPEMSKDERKACWRKLEKIYKPDVEYNGFDLLERGGYFYRQGHIYQSPFYYIDYTLAQVCALQFFVRMLENDENVWNDYVHICGLGGSKSFTEIVKEANITSPFEDGCLLNVAEKMKDELAKIDDTKL